MLNNDFHPNWVSTPGDTIADLLREKHISEAEFARQIDRSLEDTMDLLQGRVYITLSTARQLERVLGASVEFWMARDFQYREDTARFAITEEHWIKELPIDDMIKFGWIQRVSGLKEKVTACLEYFAVPNVQTWSEKYAREMQFVVFKSSKASESRPASVAAWLRKGEIEAMNINCKPWNAKAFKETLPYIRSLTRQKDPLKFVEDLKKSCAECGVAVAIVRSPRGCPAYGATKFLSNDKALLLLSFRYLTDDHFWFAFFHEAGHLILHREKGLFLEGNDLPKTMQEDEANKFAENILIPIEYKAEFLKLNANTHQVIRFAIKLGISPGIIVGQLHYQHIIPQEYLNKLRRHYKWRELDL